MTDTTREPTEAEVEALFASLPLGRWRSDWLEWCRNRLIDFEPRTKRQCCDGTGTLTVMLWSGNTAVGNHFCPGCSRCAPKVTPKSESMDGESRSGQSLAPRAERLDRGAGTPGNPQGCEPATSQTRSVLRDAGDAARPHPSTIPPAAESERPWGTFKDEDGPSPRLSPTREDDGELRISKTHELKCWPPFWRDVVDGVKTWEIRKNDRDYGVGDVLVLNEFIRDAIKGRYTGASVRVRVTYMLSGGFGLESGYCALSIVRCGP